MKECDNANMLEYPAHPYFSECTASFRFRCHVRIQGAVRSRVRFPMVSLQFFIDIILPAALWPWVDSASNRNEYEDYFLGVNMAGV
jgi:hypothetical protein